MIVSDKTIQVAGRGNFFQTSGRTSAKAGKKLKTIVMIIPGTTLSLKPKMVEELHLKILEQSHI